MRNTIILLLALLAGTAFAQAPVIDSMLIDESKGILSVYGDFGTTQGKVWCDSVELPVLTWSASLVTATIPDTGKGSAGGVEVSSNSDQLSNTRFITYWEGSATYVDAKMPFSFDHGTNHRITLFRFRFDLHSRLSNHCIYGGDISMLINSKLWVHLWGAVMSEPDHNYVIESLLEDRIVPLYREGGIYDSGFVSAIYLSISESTISITSKNAKGFLLVHMSYTESNGSYKQVFKTYPYNNVPDSKYNCKFANNFIIENGDNSQNLCKTDTVIGLPPPMVLELNNRLRLIMPVNNGFIIDTFNIPIKWDSLKYMDAYHVQLSKDSLENSLTQSVAYILDTIVSSLDFTLPPLEKNTKYYWRVCGVNTEGESRWSEVWSFTTGTSTDVRQERAKSISLTCYPNPAMNELTIVTAEPTRLLLYDVTGKIVKSEQATSNQTKWDVSLLPNGTYILGTSSGEMQVVQIVK